MPRNSENRFNFLSILSAILFLMLGWQKLPAENVRARLLDGFSEDCKIIRNDGKELKAVRMLALYAGDEIVQGSKIESIKIKCFPFVSLKKINDMSLQIAYTPPAEKGGILKAMAEFMGLVSEEHQSLSAATRSLFYAAKEIVPMPGYAATVIPMCPIPFAWNEKGGKFIVFSNGTGQEVFRKSIEGNTMILLIPEDIKMKPCESYQWHIEGISNSELHRISLLSDGNRQQVLADLKKIDSEQIDELHKKLKECSYLQFISDTYNNDIDLYWMAYQYLREINPVSKLAKEDRNFYYMLRERHSHHLQDTIEANAILKSF